jgi:MYXO-CTERM domain-containing protein
VAQVMKFVVGADLAHTGPLPIALVPVAPLSPGDAARTRDLVLDRGPAACGGQAWTIDARDWHQLTEQPRLGTSEIWRFINRSDALHSIHLQLVQFQILDRQTFTLQNDTPVPTAPAEPPAAHEAGWKDTVRIGPGEMVRIIAPFTGFAGRFAYGCEILEHQDRAMLRQFETVTSCGDGATGWPAETCDDGNTADGDGCSALCQREPTDGGDAGCGCRAASASPPGPVSWLLLALLAAPLRAIARRRAARPDRPHRRRPGRPGVPLAPRPPGGVPGRSAHGRDGATGDALTHRPDPTVATAA